MNDPGFKVILTERALLDLDGIVDRIRSDSPKNAANVAAALVESINSLEQMPARFRMVGKSRKRQSDIHAVVVYPYIIYFRCDSTAKSVHILTIVHGARRQPTFN